MGPDGTCGYNPTFVKLCHNLYVMFMINWMEARAVGWLGWVKPLPLGNLYTSKLPFIQREVSLISVINNMKIAETKCLFHLV